MSNIQVPPAVGTSGQLLDSIIIASSHNRQIVVVGSPASSAGVAPVSTGGMSVLSTSIIIASGTVTATAATNPWSSAPGFNVPIVSASSGLVQISGTPAVTITSGTVTLSSVHTVTATAATNPWSSAPGFNVPIVSASSGLVQISGTPTVTATAATNPWSSAPSFNVPIVSASSGLVQISGNVGISSGIVTLSSVHTVTATAATNPWSSAPGFNVPIVSASSGVVQTLDSTSQAYSIFMTITSSAGNLSTTIKGTPATLKGYSVFNTNAAARFFKFFNTTSAPTVGTATPVLTLLLPGSTAGAGAVQTLEQGVSFSAGLSIAITDGIATTSTGAISAGDVAANVYYT